MSSASFRIDGPVEVTAGSAAALGKAAVLALHDELALAPKPGLVSFEDSGSHDDMDAHTFMRSLFALRHYFSHIAELGEQGASFDALERCGQAAEARMLAATAGINTHRGAIFMLGLLCAAAGALHRDGRVLNPITLPSALQHHWGQALARKADQRTGLSGNQAARRHGLRSAATEAALGFPVLFDTAAPALAAGLARGLTPALARIDTLFAIMAVLEDSNLAHRGGLTALQQVQQAAREFLQCGGAAAPGGVARARALHGWMVSRHLSPGGAADMLAAACWLGRVGALPPTTGAPAQPRSDALTRHAS